MSEVIVLLDYGHGGIDPVTGLYTTKGKRSPLWTPGETPIHNKNIYYEGAGNRQIGAILEDLLRGGGINYAVLSDPYKDIRIRERTNRANALAMSLASDTKCFGISIHSNAGGGSGIEVYTSPGDTLADPIATIFIEVFSEIFSEYSYRIRKDMRDGDPDKEERFGMLTQTTMPFILPEAFFMDREEECKNILMKEEGRRRIAAWYYKAIERTIKERY